jgi:Tol biopolymer transport system component
MRPDGSDRKTVATDKWIINGSLAWSHDGRLAWVDGSADGRLTLVVGGKHHPIPGLQGSFLGVGLAWSPDDSQLAFTAADTSGIDDIWLVKADGTHLTRLTHGLGANGRLAWINP